MTIERYTNQPTYYRYPTNRAKRRICLHFNVGPDRDTAESLAKWQQQPATMRKPQNYGGYHEIVDTTVCAITAANNERVNGAVGDNDFAYHICLIGATQTREQWLDKFSSEVIENAAERTAAKCHELQIPPVKLTIAEVRANAFGIEDHWDVTRAFGEGTHTDVGAEFPWDVFMERVAHYYGPGLPPYPPEEDEMWEEQRVLEAGDHGYVGLPHNAKDVVVRCMCPDQKENDKSGAALWGSRVLDGQWQGLWDNGNQWELWVPPIRTVGSILAADQPTLDKIMGVQVENRGPNRCVVTVSGYSK